MRAKERERWGGREREEVFTLFDNMKEKLEGISSECWYRFLFKNQESCYNHDNKKSSSRKWPNGEIVLSISLQLPILKMITQHHHRRWNQRGKTILFFSLRKQKMLKNLDHEKVRKTNEKMLVVFHKWRHAFGGREYSRILNNNTHTPLAGTCWDQLKSKGTYSRCRL